MSIWDGAEVISTYTRAQAIDDGTLVDLSDTPEVAEAGFKFPVACTARVWNEVIEWPEHDEGYAVQDTKGRLWDVCWMLLNAIRRAGTTDRIAFELYVVPCEPGARKAKLVHLVAVCGPGDDAEPVITIMFPGED